MLGMLRLVPLCKKAYLAAFQGHLAFVRLRWNSVAALLWTRSVTCTCIWVITQGMLEQLPSRPRDGTLNVPRCFSLVVFLADGS